MAEAIRFPQDVHVAGRISANSMSLPTNSVSNAQVASDAGVSATKLEHQYVQTYAQPNTAATTETRAIHRARAAGSVVGFHAGSIAKAVGDSTVTVDLRLNGATILTAVVTLDNANTNRVGEAGTITGGTLAAGDLLEVVITATIGTGTLPTGVFATVAVREAAD